MTRLAVAGGLLVGMLVVSAFVAIGAQTPCDRSCLMEIADSYFAAFATHDLSKAPLAPNMSLFERSDIAAVPVARGLSNARKTEENLKEGEGLLTTMTEGPTTFKIYVPDEVSQEIGGVVMVKLENRPVEVGFHLKVDDRSITQADFVLVHITNAAALDNLRAPRPELLTAVPPAQRLSRDTLRSFAYSTYDAKGQSVSMVPFAEDCTRRENGTTAPTSSCAQRITTGEVSIIDGIPLRRVRLVDPQTGLVFSLVFNFTGGTGGLFAAAHVNKVQGNAVVSSEAAGFSTGRGISAGRGAALRDWTTLTR